MSKGAPRVASHLTITSTAPVTPAGKPPAGQPDAGAGQGLAGLFAALLDGAAPGAAGNDTTTGTPFDFNLADLLGLGADAEEGSDDPEALAAALAGTVPPAGPVMPQPLVDFIDALAALKASLDKGEPLDPDRLATLQQTLDGLAEALGLDLDSLAVPEDFSALLADIDTDEPDLATTLASLLAPLAQSLATAPAAGDAAASARLQAIGDQLAAMLAALEAGDVAPDKLASLGAAPGQKLDADIEAALARFAAGLTDADTALPEQPALARPRLEVSEPVLTGKAAGAESRADAPAPRPEPAADKRAEPASDAAPLRDADAARPHDAAAPRREARATPAPTPPAATDASNNPAPAQAQPGQPAAARLDAAANPRLVQAGYQTSQQQLNLPQIAFELGRQVTAGNTKFQIRLDPPELGRIDVRLDIDRSGQVNARLTVEKAETLDLMQRDQRGLERALQQAGLDGTKTNLEFSLRQNPFAGNAFADGRQGAPADSGFAAADPAAEAEPALPTVNLYRGALVASGVNIIA